jgi:MinD-like ATPase involved in chromosome partitioning or flagellar assembly
VAWVNKTPTILIVSKDPEVLSMESALREEGIPARVVGTISQLQQLISRSKQWIAVLDGDLPEDEVKAARTALHGEPPVPLLTLVREGAANPWTFEPNRLPTDEFAVKPLRLAELSLRIKALALRAGYDPHPVPAGAAPMSATQPARPPLGRIVTVFAGKGGVGKSTVATHLAIGLVRFYGYRTLLVDGDLWYGDVGFLLNTASKKSIFDLCQGDELDAATVQRALVRHESGLYVLLRPEEMIAAEKIDAATIERTLELARSGFDYIIVDTRASMDESTLQILDTSDQILLVTTPEVSSVANTSRFLGMTQDLGYRAKTSLIINRANSGIDVTSLANTLKMKAAATIVSAGATVVRAANEGTILFTKDPDHAQQVTKDLAQLAEFVSGEPLGDGKNSSPAKSPARKQGFAAGLRGRWAY